MSRSGRLSNIAVYSQQQSRILSLSLVGFGAQGSTTVCPRWQNEYAATVVKHIPSQAMSLQRTSQQSWLWAPSTNLEASICWSIMRAWASPLSDDDLQHLCFAVASVYHLSGGILAVLHFGAAKSEYNRLLGAAD